MNCDISIENLKNVILGINLAPFKSLPIMNIDRWVVFDAGKIPSIQYENHNINYQVNGSISEKITVRFFISAEQKILKVKYYYLKGTDEELAHYIVMELILRISQKYPLDKDYIIKKLKYL